MLKKVFLPPAAGSKSIRYGFTQDNIHRVYELPFKIKGDIATFQYKIIYNILPTRGEFYWPRV